MRLRAAQFGEDSGPMAHPIRPDSYIKMDNFYTVTVYEKVGGRYHGGGRGFVIRDWSPLGSKQHLWEDWARCECQWGDVVPGDDVLLWIPVCNQTCVLSWVLGRQERRGDSA
jgi:hypothetical protein